LTDTIFGGGRWLLGTVSFRRRKTKERPKEKAAMDLLLITASSRLAQQRGL